MVDGRAERQLRAERIADQTGALNAARVHQPHDVIRQCAAPIERRIVRARALAVPPKIKGDAPLPPLIKGGVPAGALPTFVAIGAEAVNQHDAPNIRRARVVIDDLQTVQYQCRHVVCSTCSLMTAQQSHFGARHDFN